MKTLLFSLMICVLPISAQNEKYYSPLEVDQKIVVTKRPAHPKATRDCKEFEGLTVLRVFFHKSAVIDRVETVSPSSCMQFDAAAIKAANEIRFKPALKDSQQVSYDNGRRIQVVEILRN